jgi:ATP-dependent Clp protease ATP-binding subunit ClpB
LTEAIRRRPYAVILLDEIEKAHADVFNVLLQVLDDGRLTDGQGRTVDFRNSILIMTSNLGSDRIRNYSGETAGTGYEMMKLSVLEELRKSFRPEFLNRIDEIVVFHSLRSEHIRRIVDIQFERLRQRLAARHITAELTDEAKDHLVRVGYEPDYGARPLKRAIQRELENRLAKALLEGKVRDGQSIRIDSKRGEITFEQKEPVAAQ